MAAALQEPFQQELGRGIQEGLLAVWGANILGRADWGGVFYFLETEQKISIGGFFISQEDKILRSIVKL